MNHRVIFVPDDYWTNPPKENIMSAPDPNELNARDVRMAAALIKHHRSADREGMLAIASDPDVIDRGSPLLWCILDLHRLYLVSTRTPTGIDALGVYVQDIAAIPLDGTDEAQLTRWACQIVDAHGRGDIPDMNAVLDAARPTGQCTHILLAVLDLFLHAVPELSSSTGNAWLNECVAAAIGEEGAQQ